MRSRECIFGGFVTVTEAAGLGVFGATAVGIARGRLPWARIEESLVEALRTSAAANGGRSHASALPELSHGDRLSAPGR